MNRLNYVTYCGYMSSHWRNWKVSDKAETKDRVKD